MKHAKFTSTNVHRHCQVCLFLQIINRYVILDLEEPGGSITLVNSNEIWSKMSLKVHFSKGIFAQTSHLKVDSQDPYP